MKDQLAGTYLSAGSMAYVESLYQDYLTDPHSVSEQWRTHFDALGHGRDPAASQNRFDVQARYVALGRQWPGLVAEQAPASAQINLKQSAVDRLVDAYRYHGHLEAQLDPLGESRPPSSALSLSSVGLSQADLDSEFVSPKILGHNKHVPLRQIIERLRKIYCGSAGVEYATIPYPDEVEWIRSRIEAAGGEYLLSPQAKQRLVQGLIEAEGMEQYLGRKYVAQKRFSVEGGETVIPMLREIIETGAKAGVDEVMLSMAHRGRLNVLFNIMGMPAKELCERFEGTRDLGVTSGDVKYHLGYSGDCEVAGRAMHMSLAYNPSHLEAIVPVAMGSARARQDSREAESRQNVLNVTIHGDASVAGLGVIQETLNMAGPPAYRVCGTIHIVINNQIGFTLSNPEEARTGEYCTNIARSIDCPIFHVNGDDPEACVFFANLAMAYRNHFHKDVFIDLWCYRRLGHNEADEPIATQPKMYRAVREHPSTLTLYAQRLVDEGVLSEADIKQRKDAFVKLMDEGLPSVPVSQEGVTKERDTSWHSYIDRDWREPYETGLPLETLQSLAQIVCTVPEGFKMQKQVKALMEQRLEMAAGQRAVNWGFAETLAYASLLSGGHGVRLVGEDTQRGTFAHRHALLHDQDTCEDYLPLSPLVRDGVNLSVYNSVLSEFAALGFEYGYASTRPQDLVLWEAQFGDFANGGQVIIDQFISSAWQKWRRLSGLVMLLPHGYEGMGPEHSSARLERFLQLCAQDNMQVCVPTTPAQIYHLLRRQVVRRYRRPLIVMTPKSLLRHPLAVSRLEDLAEGKYQLLIPDETVKHSKSVKRLIITCGKVYYDLVQAREAAALKDVAIVRIEQLYPFPDAEFAELLKPFAHVADCVWCQEEPMNQGAWYTVQHHVRAALSDGQHLRYAGRKPMAAPAGGYPKLHKLLQEALISDALGLS